MFLLDTNVVSAGRKPDPAIARWISLQDGNALFLSVITLGEITRGIVMKQRTDPAAATALSSWLAGLRNNYADRILDVDEKVAVRWGHIAAVRTRGDADGLIAATAMAYDLTIVTRNVADFEDIGVALLNPWSL